MLARTPKAHLALTLALILGLSACQNTTAPETGPQVPSVAGNWRGDFRGATVLMSLQQNGADVVGTVQMSGDTYDLTGTVDEFGTFAFASRTQDPNSCRTFATQSAGVAVTGQGTEMDGVAARRTPAGGASGPCDGRTLVEQGDLAAERV